ncbi:MAG: hypothetical protein ABI921_05180 [Panacibacter sp.]
MGRISIITYFLILLSLLSVCFLVKDTSVGVIYFLFTVFSVLSLQLFKSNFYKATYLLLLSSVVAGYFLRPLILVDHPELFKYTKIASTTDIETIKRSLYFALLNMVIISAAFILVIKLVPDKVAVEKKESNYLLKHFNIINLLIVAITLAKILLNVFASTGSKIDTNRDTTFGFVLRFLSPDLAFYVYYIYLTKYWKKLNVVKRYLVLLMIFLTSLSVFLTGSKIFLALFGLCFFLNFVYNNRKIKVSNAILLSTVGIAAIVFSFAMAFAVKYSSGKDLVSILTKAKTYTDARDYIALGDDITGRLSGLDGQIAAYIVADKANERIENALKKSFSPKELALHTIDNILPRVQLANSPNTGKAISENIVGFASDAQHGGSLGLFASISYTCGDLFYIFDIALGVFLGIYFTWTRSVKNDDLRFILFSIGGYFIIRLVFSGNFDTIFSDFITEWIMLFFYIQFIRLSKL